MKDFHVVQMAAIDNYFLNAKMNLGAAKMVGG